MIAYSPTITICGSMHFSSEMIQIEQELKEFSYQVHIPTNSKLDPIKAKREAGSDAYAIAFKQSMDFIGAHHTCITQSEAILVLNHNKHGCPGYIGANTLMEIGFAHVLGRKIFLWQDPDPHLQALAEVLATYPTIIRGDLSKINAYFASLPTALLTSESDLKLQGLSLALCDNRTPHRLFGKKVPSGVGEEPMSFEETYAGALGRLINLKNIPNRLPKNHQECHLYVSIEGGNDKILKDHNYWGHHICVIETKDGKRSTGMTQDIEIPQSMWDLVPSKYPDLGVLVQKEYGAVSKDPYTYISHDKIKRLQFIKDAVRNALVMM